MRYESGYKMVHVVTSIISGMVTIKIINLTNQPISSCLVYPIWEPLDTSIAQILQILTPPQQVVLPTNDFVNVPFLYYTATQETISIGIIISFPDPMNSSILRMLDERIDLPPISQNLFYEGKFLSTIQGDLTTAELNLVDYSDHSITEIVRSLGDYLHTTFIQLPRRDVFRYFSLNPLYIVEYRSPMLIIYASKLPSMTNFLSGLSKGFMNFTRIGLELGESLVTLQDILFLGLKSSDAITVWRTIQRLLRELRITLNESITTRVCQIFNQNPTLEELSETDKFRIEESLHLIKDAVFS